MTVEFRQYIDCPNCHERITAETAFCRWMREQKELDSQSSGVVRADCDHIVHRYRLPMYSKDVQAMMIVEVKTHVTFSTEHPIRITELDTLHLANQVLFSDCSTDLYTDEKWVPNRQPCKAYSAYSRRWVQVVFYGVHGLYFSGTHPTNSDRIEWDRKQITPMQLVQLLRFDLNPDTLEPMTILKQSK